MLQRSEACTQLPRLSPALEPASGAQMPRAPVSDIDMVSLPLTMRLLPVIPLALLSLRLLHRLRALLFLLAGQPASQC